MKMTWRIKKAAFTTPLQVDHRLPQNSICSVSGLSVGAILKEMCPKSWLQISNVLL